MQVPSLVRELSPHMAWDMPKKAKKSWIKAAKHKNAYYTILYGIFRKGKYTETGRPMAARG